jgi:hypothetical protein
VVDPGRCRPSAWVLRFAQDDSVYEWVTAVANSVGFRCFDLLFQSLIQLAQRRRKISEGKECRVNFFYELPVRFGFVVDALPLRVILEGLPVVGRGFAAGMTKNVDQGVVFLRLIYGGPIGDAVNPVALEEFYRVVAEAGQQIWQFSRGSVIDAEFVDRCRRLRGIGFALLSGGPQRCRKKCDGGKRLQQGSSFHGRNSNRRCAV